MPNPCHMQATSLSGAVDQHCGVFLLEKACRRDLSRTRDRDHFPCPRSIASSLAVEILILINTINTAQLRRGALKTPRPFRTSYVFDTHAFRRRV